MEKNKLQVICELCASLNKTYIESFRISSTPMGADQFSRLNKVWKEVEKALGIYIPEK